MDPNYLKKFFNSKEYSDLILKDDNNNILHLHSFILRQYEYFDTWFKSSISDKTVIRVPNTTIAKILIAYFYGNEFIIDPNMDYDEFFDLVDLTQMWLLPQKIKDQEFMYVVKNLDNIIKKDMNYTIPLYNYFENQPTIQINKESLRNGVIQITRNGKWLVEYIKNYISNNILNLNGGFINLPVAKFLPYDKYIIACIEHKYYDKIADHAEINNTNYINSLNKYINDYIRKIDSTILTSKIGKLLDLENNTILSLKFNMYDKINQYNGVPDEILIKRLNNYIDRIINQCNKKILDTKIITYLDPQILANLYVKFGEYNKLLDIQSHCIKEAFKVYYTVDIFTINQLNAILSADSIVTTTNEFYKHKSSWKILHLQSFIPFNGTLYTLVGQCKRKGFDTVTIKINKSLSKNHKIRINNEEYTIKLMKSNNNQENDIIRPVFELIEYTIQLDKDIDNLEENKEYYVYKIRELKN